MKGCNNLTVAALRKNLLTSVDFENARITTVQLMEKPTKRLRAKSTELTTTSLPPILQDSISTKEFKYGTAGFRDNHGLLRGVLIRVGVLAALKSRLHEGKKVIGLMVTASHNPECDNGVKIVDFDGGMLSQSWEPYAEDLVNADSESKAMEVLSSIESREGNKEDNYDKDVKKDVSEAVVLIGRDTRPHSEALFGFAQRGAMAMGAVVLDAGEVTTPQLHYLVLKMNSEGYRNPIRVKEIYFSTLAEGFIELLQTHEDEGKRRPHIRLLLDGSNGIGALQVIPLINTINALQQGTLEVDIRNKVGDGPVNEGCGAEIVQKTQLPPLHFNAVKDLNITAASFDGDADRIVFHSFRTPPKSLPSSESSLWSLVDGDKIAALISLFLLEELTALDWLRSWKFGVVQTAYANGASTLFLKSQSVRILYAKTGVKYVHEKAHSFDVGVYFEANGHGTVLFSSALQQELQSAFRLRSSRVNNRKSIALRRLQVLIK